MSVLSINWVHIKFFLRLFRLCFFCLLFLTSCASLPRGAHEAGLASWYGKAFHGRRSANGSKFNMNSLTAAHPDLAFGTMVKVVNEKNGRSVVVKITDRGPFSGGRIIDLSKEAARRLGFISAGVAPVVLYLVREP